jgi:hypothetical protein
VRLCHTDQGGDGAPGLGASVAQVGDGLREDGPFRGIWAFDGGAKPANAPTASCRWPLVIMASTSAKRAESGGRVVVVSSGIG